MEKQHSQLCYYTLRMIGSSAHHADGDLLQTTDSILNIGESADCEIRYDRQVGADYYATILRNDDGEGWRMVRRTDGMDITVDGYGDIGYVYELSDGDVLHFANHTMGLRFRVRRTDHQLPTGTVIAHVAHRLSMLYTLLSILSVAIIGIIGWLYVENRQAGVRYRDVRPLSESIFTIRVDSVQWLSYIDGKDSLIAPTKTFEGSNPVGTAFLTTDGRLVTARHCIEYWMVRRVALDTHVMNMAEDDIVRWAVLTETARMEGQDCSLRVFCSVYAQDNEQQPVFRFSSTDDSVHIHRAHDEIILLADFTGDYYWRTIQPYFQNHKMLLDDVAWVDVPVKGNIPLATASQMNELAQGDGIALMGFPDADNGNRRLSFAQGKLYQEIHPDECLLMDINVNHGFSGCPVFARTHDGVVAVGVMSRADSISSGTYKWAVPITEI